MYMDTYLIHKINQLNLKSIKYTHYNKENKYYFSNIFESSRYE